MRVESLAHVYRREVRKTLGPLVMAYYPALISAGGQEFAKMLELSAKMTLVGHACSELAGYPFDARRQRVAILFGGCCFLADSFLDDFGEVATREYLERFVLLLEAGWFEIRNDRERLFYVILALLFLERDVLDPILRQAILRLHAAQAEDVMLRLEPGWIEGVSARQRLLALRRCARNRSGHAIIALAGFLVPQVTLAYLTAIFTAGALIMFIDDHGDCYADLKEGRITYMNQLRDPERALARIFTGYLARLSAMLAPGEGRVLLIGFLTRYYLTRLEKHRRQRQSEGAAWDVYE